MKASDRARVRLMPRVKHIHLYNTIVSLKGRTVRYGCDVCPAIEIRRYRLVDPNNHILKGYAPASAAVKAQAFRKSVAQAVQTAPKALKTSGWLSGSEGDRTDPQGPNATVVVLPLETTPEEIDAARQSLRQAHPPRPFLEGDDGVLMKVDLIDYGPHSHGLGRIEEVHLSDSDRDHLLNEIGKDDERFLNPAPEVPAVALPEADMHIDPEHPHADIPEPPAEVFYSEAQLIDMSKDEVYAVAAGLNIAGRSTMKKAGLITAILGVQENNFKSADSLR